MGSRWRVSEVLSEAGECRWRNSCVFDVVGRKMPMTQRIRGREALSIRLRPAFSDDVMPSDGCSNSAFFTRVACKYWYQSPWEHLHQTSGDSTAISMTCTYKQSSTSQP